ncbi:MAG TPA: hypothetical protein VNI36_04895 [Candidatus Dormibacteraeota bacterium]|nr:hypothetical protein [Candidatus Dormibacteraeota bacterium]
MMKIQSNERCHTANEELRDFLRQAEVLADKSGTVREADVIALSSRLAGNAPEVGDASRGETLDAGLRVEIGEYVKNLRAVQSTIERVRYEILAHKLQTEMVNRQHDNLPGWPYLRHQTN